MQIDKLFVTAGHCGDPGDRVLQEVTTPYDEDDAHTSFLAQLLQNLTGQHKKVRLTPVGKFIAKAGQTSNGSTIDIALVQLDSGKSLSGGYAQVPINISQPVPGMHICKVGTISGRTCGSVISLNRSIKPENYRATLIADEAKICVLSGDSGGPVITNGAAVGLVTAGEDVQFCNPFDRPESYITDLGTGLKILQSTYPSLHLT